MSAEKTVSAYTIKSLGPGTWPAFVDLAERHNGVWGGCWCSWFHAERAKVAPAPEATAPSRSGLFKKGKAHAALVFDGEVAIGWCQYGTPTERPASITARSTKPGST